MSESGGAAIATSVFVLTTEKIKILKSERRIKMKYKYYGTAAAEAIPAIWCDCDTCERARKKGGRNIMSRSQ